VITANLPALIPDLPADVASAIAGKEGSVASTILAQYRTQLAVRRTDLADLRTAVSFISFGITLNRFSVFLEQQGALMPGQHAREMLRDTGNVGAGMVILGLVVVLWSLYRFWHVNRDIASGNFRPLTRAVIIYTFFVLALGGISAVWLFRA
jgi:putative membrane protein